MFSFLFKCIRTFGFTTGLLLYVRLKLFRSGTFSLPGLKAPIFFRQNRMDMGTFREIFIREEYNIDLPKGFDPKVIIDAGANIGFTTLFFHRRFPNASIYSLEPNADNFSLLQKNTSSYPTITPIQKALFNSAEPILLEDKGYGVRGYMVTSGSEGKGETLPATTLQHLIRQFQLTRIDILKMDIEGSEKEVFEHDPAAWLPITACVIVELHDRMKDGCSKAVFRAINQYNFHCELRGANLIFYNQDLF